MSRSNRDGKRGGGHKQFLGFCRVDWWPLCCASKGECKHYSKCYSAVKHGITKVKNKKVLLARVKDEDYNI